MKESITAQDAVELLNAMLAIDRAATESLVFGRVLCNQELADHPTVQVGLAADGGFEVGLIGVLNGMFGTYPNGWGCIGYECGTSARGPITRFRVLAEDEPKNVKE